MADGSISEKTLVARVYPRSEHPVSRSNISKNATKVLYRLKDAGYQAHLVGGGVRDLMMGIKPKDFDVATDASPEQVKSLFRNSRLVGRRFRLAHVLFGRDVIEVATFRADHSSGQGGEAEDSGRILRDNVYGDLKDDVLRRDFTVNALYYNIADFSIIDYVGAMDDLKSNTLRLIGDPEKRFTEDPVRTLRAARFAAKLNFSIHPETEKYLVEHAYMLEEIPPARLFEEALKLLHTGHATASFGQLIKYDLLQYLFPLSDKRLKDGEQQYERFIKQALTNTDKRIHANQSVNPAFLFAVFLWPMVWGRAESLQSHGVSVYPALQQAADEIVAHQLYHTAIPKRFAVPMREIWMMQPRLLNNKGPRALKFLDSPRFRAAYDFFCLRAESGENKLKPLSKWWTEIQEKNPRERINRVRKDSYGEQPRRKRRRRNRQPKQGGGNEINGNV